MQFHLSISFVLVLLFSTHFSSVLGKLRKNSFQYKKHIKVPKNRDVLSKGVKVSHIEKNTAKRTKSSYTPITASLGKTLRKFIDPTSLAYHFAPSGILFLLSRGVNYLHIPEQSVRTVSRVVALGYLLLMQILLWYLRRTITSAGDDSLVDNTAGSILELLGRTAMGPQIDTRTVMAYDISEVDRLQSGMGMEASLIVLMLSLRLSESNKTNRISC